MLLNQTSEDEAVVVVVVEAAEVVAPSVSTPAFMVLSVSSNEPRRNDRMNRICLRNELIPGYRHSVKLPVIRARSTLVR